MIDDAITYSIRHAGQAIYIMVDGKMVAENYHNGFASTDAKDIESCSKSIAGIIAAKLIDQGHMASYDTLVGDHIPDWAAGSAQKQACTVRRLLALTSGLNPALGSSPAYATSIAANMPLNDVGTFKYGSNPFGVFAAFVHDIVQPTYDDWVDYVQTEVFTPRGITISSVDNTSGGAGEPNLSHGVHLTARNAALIGEYMRMGITSNNNLRILTQPGPDYWAYGINFWRTTDQAGGVAGTANPSKFIPGGGFAAAGNDNQRIYVLPAEGMVVARFGTEDSTWSDATFLNHLLEPNPPRKGGSHGRRNRLNGTTSIPEVEARHFKRRQDIMQRLTALYRELKRELPPYEQYGVIPDWAVKSDEDYSDLPPASDVDFAALSRDPETVSRLIDALNAAIGESRAAKREASQQALIQLLRSH